MSRNRWLILAVVTVMGLGAWGLFRGGLPQAIQERQPRDRVARPADTPGARDAHGVPRWAPQPGAPERRVAGRVTADGKPVAGAEVRLHLPTAGSEAAGPPLRTGPDGRFDFGTRPPVQIIVGASAPGHAPVTRRLDLADPVLRPDQLELRLTGCPATTYGTVRDASGGPVVGAQLRAEGVIGVDSGADGGYQLCFDGTTSVRVDAAGYGSVELRFEGRGRQRRDVILVPESVIEGRVVRDDDGSPVPGALVWAFAFEMGQERPAMQGAISDESGAFRLAGLHFARYRLSATHGGLRTADNLQVTLPGGATSDGHVLRLVAKPSLSGVVLRDGKPLPGARVVISAKSQRGGSMTTSQADGTFLARLVDAGPATIEVVGHRVLAPTEVNIAAEGTTGLRVEVAPKAVLRGRVLRLGKPVPGALVNAQFVRTEADAEGGYELTGLPAGEVAVSAQSDRAGAFVNNVKVTLAEGEEKVLDLELTGGAVIAGDVVDQAGKPVAGARVEWEHVKTGDYGPCVTDEAGRYQCASMTGGGDYAAKVFPSEQGTAALPWAGNAPATVALADGNARVDGVRLAVLNERKSIEGRVVDGAGEPIADARVRALAVKPGSPPQFPSWVAMPQTRTDVDGAFILADLGPGTYALRAQTPDGGDAQVRDVVAGARNVVVVVARPGGLRGRLVGFSSEPQVTVLAVDGPTKFLQATVEGTTFHIDAIPAGKYVVSANADDGADAELVEIRTGVPAETVLESQGAGTLEIIIVEQGTGTPLPGFRCGVGIRAGAWRSFLGFNPETTPVTDAAGRVTRAVPAGDLVVTCYSPSPHSPAQGAGMLARGGKLSLRLQAVRALDDGGWIGVLIDPARVGTTITSVVPGSPAARADLRAGDQLISVDGVPAAEVGPGGMMTLIGNHAPGQTLTLVVERAGVARTVTVTMALRPS